MKNSNDTIGNRTRDRPVCSAVPQPTASSEYYIKKSLMTCTAHQINQIKKTELGGTCGTYWGQEGCIKGFSGDTLRKDTTWKT